MFLNNDIYFDIYITYGTVIKLLCRDGRGKIKLAFAKKKF